MIVLPSPGSSQQSPPLAPKTKEGWEEEESAAGRARGSALESSPVARLTHSGRVTAGGGEGEEEEEGPPGPRASASASSTSLRPGSSLQSGSSSADREEEEDGQ